MSFMTYGRCLRQAPPPRSPSAKLATSRILFVTRSGKQASSDPTRFAVWHLQGIIEAVNGANPRRIGGIMANRCAMRSTTMLSGIVGWTLLTMWTAGAADLAVYPRAPAAYPAFAPAVDAPNGKFDAFAGSVAGKSIVGIDGV
jgi:hypothetical protein